MNNDIGVIGMAVMGQGVARNLANNGYMTSVYNRDYEKTKNVTGENLFGYEKLEDFVASLTVPRKIAILVKAGEPTDAVIDSLVPLLDSGDIVMDLGNSFYKDTERREKRLKEKGLRFMGIGISGGEKGALEGPSVMPGGDPEAWQLVKNVLEAISAANPDGGRCCGYFGQGGAGHFTKMVHNGIEYAYMGVISEIYSVAKEYFSLTNEENQAMFENFAGDSDVSSYLVEITAEILKVKDDKGHGYLVDKIRDRAGNKGTGKWTSEAALELGIATPTLTAALFARYLSSDDELRKGDGTRLKKFSTFGEGDLELVKKTLEFTQYICFDQGLRLIKKASAANSWGVIFEDVLRTWENGCIIRTGYSTKMKRAFAADNDLGSILFDESISQVMEENLRAARTFVAKAVDAGCYIPCISSAVTYYDGIYSEVLPTAMIQAQRDYFGAHTYERNDMEGSFHTKWED